MRLPEHRTVELTRLIGIVNRVHEATMNLGYDSPGVEPVLFTLRDMGEGRIKGYVMDGPSSMWEPDSPANVLDSINPMPGLVPDDFCGCLLTFEAWFITAPMNDPQAIDEMTALANARRVFTRPDRLSARLTMAYAVDGQWVQYMHIQGSDAPKVATSQSAEHNHHHYRGWHESSVCVALAGLVNRIQADIDARYEEDE